MRVIAMVLASLMFISCNNNSSGSSDDLFKGTLSKGRIYSIRGFEENRSEILKREEVSIRDFIVWSTDSAWSLASSARTALKGVREAIELPGSKTVLQKVIPLDDLGVYMNNVYGGTIGGFVSTAADVKKLSTLSDVYWGMRLDYEGTKHRPNGGGYGVIRFYSDAASRLTIPYCVEMGGSQAHNWPSTGGGFTASKLSDGGYPEYTFNAYSAPRDGAELYEVTPEGREILRSTYFDGRGWQTNEIGATPPQVKVTASKIRNGVFTDTKGGRSFVTTYALYHGNRYIVRGEVNGDYHLTTMVAYDGEKLEVVDKGIYGIAVAVDKVERVWEEVEKML